MFSHYLPFCRLPSAVLPRKSPASFTLNNSFNIHFASANDAPLCLHMAHGSSTTSPHIPLLAHHTCLYDVEPNTSMLLVLVLTAVVQVTCHCHRSMLLLLCAVTAVPCLSSVRPSVPLFELSFIVHVLPCCQANLPLHLDRPPTSHRIN